MPILYPWIHLNDMFREIRELFYDLTYKRKNNHHYKELGVKIFPNLPIGGESVDLRLRKSQHERSGQIRQQS